MLPTTNYGGLRFVKAWVVHSMAKGSRCMVIAESPSLPQSAGFRQVFEGIQSSEVLPTAFQNALG
jgi:hypothetical protein